MRTSVATEVEWQPSCGGAQGGFGRSVIDGDAFGGFMSQMLLASGG